MIIVFRGLSILIIEVRSEIPGRHDKKGRTFSGAVSFPVFSNSSSHRSFDFASMETEVKVWPVYSVVCDMSVIVPVAVEVR